MKFKIFFIGALVASSFSVTAAIKKILKNLKFNTKLFLEIVPQGLQED